MNQSSISKTPLPEVGGLNILITGGTGLIGSRLTEFSLQKGYQVSYLSRRKEQIPNVKVYQWDIEKGFIEDGALSNADYIIHLAGAGIADKRWTDARKKELIDSRVKPIELIISHLQKNPSQKLKGFLSASGIGFYGAERGDEKLTESSLAGNDFLAECTKQWESASNKIADLGIRLIRLRIGVVLSNKGGALPQLTQPIRYYVGAALGSGQQWISWIHVDDLCRMFIYSIENQAIRGEYNAVAPNPVTNQNLTKISAKSLKKPLWLPNVPAFMMKLMLGEMAQIVLGSTFVLNDKITRTGFDFEFIDTEKTLMDLLKID
jgi:uncharacterized protein